MDISINANLFLIKNSCNGCLHCELCKYRQKKEAFENLIMEDKSNSTSPIRLSLDCDKYQPQIKSFTR